MGLPCVDASAHGRALSKLFLKKENTMKLRLWRIAFAIAGLTAFILAAGAPNNYGG